MAKKPKPVDDSLVHWMTDLGSRLCDDLKIMGNIGPGSEERSHDPVTCVACLRSWIWRLKAHQRASLFSMHLPTFWVERAVGFEDYTDLCRHFMRPKQLGPLLRWTEKKKPTKRALLSMLEPGE